MTKIFVLAGGVLDLELARDYDVYVGVDAGAKKLLQEGLPLDLAVGDFDSVSQKEWQAIQDKAKEVLTAQVEKDDTDLELALMAIFERWSEAHVTIYGALDGRLDHTLSNLFLVEDPRFSPFMEQIHLINKLNQVNYLSQGKRQLVNPGGYRYVSFMPSVVEGFEIAGAKYPLNSSNFFRKKIYSSNEFIDEDIVLTIPEGYVLVIYSKDQTSWMF